MLLSVRKIWGLGWRRDMSTQEVNAMVVQLHHVKHLLSETEHRSAMFVLGVDYDGYGGWHKRNGVRVLREHLSPDDVGVPRLSLVFPEGPEPWFTGAVAKAFCVTPDKLRELISKAREIKELDPPPRNCGRTNSDVGWFVWWKTNVEQFHAAILRGSFTNWKRKSSA